MRKSKKKTMAHRKKKLTKKEQAEVAATAVDTIGRVGERRRKDSKRDFRGNAVRRLGRQDGHAHHGTASIHVPASVRTGSGARPASNLIRS